MSVRRPIDLATGSVAPGAQSFRAQDARGWKDGRAQSWHLTLEREVLPNTALRLSYIGDHGSDLEQKPATQLVRWSTPTSRGPSRRRRETET